MMSKLTPAEQITKESYDRVATQWEADHDIIEFWEESLYKFHELLPAGRLLEIGCGAGRDAQDLIRLGYKYVGTDISGPQLVLARKNNPGARFEQVSLYDLDFPEPFDGFWCAAVLVHVPKNRTVEALSAIRRNLVPGAIGFLAIKEGKGERLEIRDELGSSEFLFTYWEDDEFREVLRQEGFKVLHKGYKPMSERTKWLKYIVRLKD